MEPFEKAKSEVEDEGMSTKKKVAAGAAIGVAVPAAVGVAKKLLGNGGDSGDSEQRSSQSRGGSSGTRSRTAATRSQASRRGSTSRRSSTTTKRRSSTSSSGGPQRTKEQLYNQAKRLNIEGRSKMTKAQLQRAVSRAKS
jgi:hypothetical protein